MRGPERGFLLLTGTLGIPERKPLTLSQLRILSSRVKQSDVQGLDRELMAEDLVALGYGEDMAKHIVMLLSDEAILDRYLQRGKKAGCVPISRVSDAYPDMLRQRLGLESPGCLWIKGKHLLFLLGSLRGTLPHKSSSQIWQLGEDKIRNKSIL